MYPQAELIRLAARKAALRRDIAARRAQCAGAAATLARPLLWLDRATDLARRLAPFAAVPLGLLAMRAVFPRLRLPGSLAFGFLGRLGRR
jgi:hypothetical protein